MRKLNTKNVGGSPFRLEIEERIAKLQERSNGKNIAMELLILQNLKFCLKSHHSNQNVDVDALIQLTKESIQSFFLNHLDGHNSKEFYSRNVNWVVRQRILELI